MSLLTYKKSVLTTLLSFSLVGVALCNPEENVRIGAPPTSGTQATTIHMRSDASVLPSSLPLRSSPPLGRPDSISISAVARYEIFGDAGITRPGQVIHHERKMTSHDRPLALIGSAKPIWSTSSPSESPGQPYVDAHVLPLMRTRPEPAGDVNRRCLE